MKLVIVAGLALALTASASASLVARPSLSQPAKTQLRLAQIDISHARYVIHYDRATLWWIDHHRAALLDPVTAFKTGAFRSYLRRSLRSHVWLLGYGRREAAQARSRMNPFRVPASFLGQALCVHGGEGAWDDDTGNGFGGGLQFMVGTWNGAARASRGRVPFVRSTGDIARQPPVVQIYAAYVIVVLERAGWGQWPNTARACGLL